MKLTETQTTQYGLNYWVAQTMKTRRYGHTYVHSGARASANWAWEALTHDGIVFSFTGWGRSLTSRGHKYKVHARYAQTGKPVPSKVLASL